MPKEIIHERGSTRAVVVGWQKDTDVQVGTVDEATGGHDATCSGGRSNGFFATLDRQGCNDLIRNLRRARDQAFGRDE